MNTSNSDTLVVAGYSGSSLKCAMNRMVIKVGCPGNCDVMIDSMINAVNYATLTTQTQQVAFVASIMFETTSLSTFIDTSELEAGECGSHVM
jgi:hypothetical protein